MKKNNGPLQVTMRVTDREIDRRVLLEAGTLVQSGYKVTVIAGPYPSNAKVAERTTWEGVKIYRLKDVNTMYYLKLQRLLNNIHRFCKHNPILRIARFVFRRLFRSLERCSVDTDGKLYHSSQLAVITGIFLLMPFLLFEYFKQLYLEMFSRIREIIASQASKNVYDKAKVIYEKEMPDICHAHDITTLEEMYNVSKQYNSKFVYDSHELYVEIGTLTSYQKKRLTQLEANLIKKTDLVITINDSIAEELSQRYNISKPLIIMNCTKSLNNVQPHTCYYLHDKLNLHRSVGIFLYQGNLTPRRGLDVFVESARFLNTDNIKLVLLGNDGESCYKKELLDIVKKYSLQDNVIFLESVPQEKLLYHTISAKAGVIPYGPVDLNTYYCTPNKLFEFIAAHVPIISNDLPELKKLVEGNKIGIATDLSTPEKMAQAINEMHKNNAKYVQFKKNLISVAKELCWENESSRLIRGYDLLSTGSEKC